MSGCHSQQGLRRQSGLQQAIQELGRLAKTRHVLAFVDDERLRRRVMVGLNRQESLHAMARSMFFGRQGRFGERGYEAQLNRASALSLAINAIVVWNTRYLAAAAAELDRRGETVALAARPPRRHLLLRRADHPRRASPATRRRPRGRCLGRPRRPTVNGSVDRIVFERLTVNPRQKLNDTPLGRCRSG